MGSMAEFFARGQQIAGQRQAQDMQQKVQQSQHDKIMEDRAIEKRRTSPGYMENLAKLMDSATPTDQVGGLMARLEMVDATFGFNNRQQNLQQKSMDEARQSLAADRVKQEANRAADNARADRAQADMNARFTEGQNRADARAAQAEAGRNARDNPPATPKPLSSAQERSIMDTLRSKILETKLGITAREFDSGKAALPEDMRGIAPEQINQKLAEAVQKGLGLYKSGMPIEDVTDEVSGALDYTPAKDSALSRMKPASLTSGGAATKKKADTQAPDATARQMIRDSIASGQPVSGPALMKATGLSREEIQRIFDEENK